MPGAGEGHRGRPAQVAVAAQDQDALSVTLASPVGGHGDGPLGPEPSLASGGRSVRRATVLRSRRCASSSSGSTGSATCRRSSPMTTLASPRSSIRAATSTSTSRRPASQGVRIEPRRRDAPPQRLRLRGPRARRADRGHPRRSAAEPSSRYEHRGLARRRRRSRSGRLRFTALDTPGHTPEHVVYAVADTTRADEPVRCSAAARCWSARSGGPTCSAKPTPSRTPRQMHRSLHDVLLPHGGLRGRPPDARRGLALLDRDLVDAVDDHRFRAPLQRAAPRRWTPTRSPGRCSPASRDPALLRPDATASTRPVRALLGGTIPQPAALSVRGRRGRRGSGRAHRRCATGRRPRRRAHPGLALDPAR